MPFTFTRHVREIVLEKVVDEFCHSLAASTIRNQVSLLLENRNRICNRHRTLAGVQQRMIVLCVAYADSIVRREAQLP